MRASFHICILLALLGILGSGCKDIYDQELYQNPEWLAGKLYTQVAGQENLSKFAECLRIVGFDTLLDRSGSFTIFAPHDQAIDAYLAQNQHQSVEDIPREELEQLIKFHIIQDAWSTRQLQMLDLGGWIDPVDPDSKPRSYKQQTLLKNPDEKYWTVEKKGEDIIVLDSSRAETYKKVFTRSRKFVPIFFDEFFDIYNLTPEDYSFYFNRPFEAGNIFYAGGKVTQAEIFAENGFVFVIDRVVTPMLNAKELLERDLPGESYNTFLELIYQFPKFRSNLVETYNQPESRAGGAFDTLYNLSFPKLPFDLHEELTGPNINDASYTYLYHNGVYVPTDEAFQLFIDEVVTASSGYPHWADFESVPLDVKQIIVKSHFTPNPVYPSDMKNGFLDGDGNIIRLNQTDVIRKEFGSNCTFMGLSKTVVPRAFSSVTGPVYLRPEYSSFMYAMQKSRVLSAVMKEDTEYCFFPIPDEILDTDSSLMINWIDRDLNQYNFSALDRSLQRMVGMPSGVLGKRILNQVGTSLPNGSANKEFIETLGGNYIIWNNNENTVSGGLANVYGYRGDSAVFYNPVIFEEPADNGNSWSVDSWFRNPTADLYGILFSRFRTFLDLLERAGLFDAKRYEFPFLVEGKSYTIFVPSDDAIAERQLDTLSTEELYDILSFHFIPGEKIFTDNKKLWKHYDTLREDESSTQYSTNYSSMNIRPGPDLIEILDNSDNLYVSMAENSSTNVLVAYDTDPENIDDTDYIITTVIHQIDKVLEPEIIKQ